MRSPDTYSRSLEGLLVHRNRPFEAVWVSVAGWDAGVFARSKRQIRNTADKDGGYQDGHEGSRRLELPTAAPQSALSTPLRLRTPRRTLKEAEVCKPELRAQR